LSDTSCGWVERNDLANDSRMASPKLRAQPPDGPAKTAYRFDGEPLEMR
jgi:hypothetical protein